MQKRTCKECGKEFTLSDGEIRFYQDKHLSLPKRCKECRARSKSKKTGSTHSNLQAYKPKLYVNNKNKDTEEKKNISKKQAIAGILFVLILILYFLTDSISLFDNNIDTNEYLSTLDTQTAVEVDGMQNEPVDSLNNTETVNTVTESDEHIGSEPEFVSEEKFVQTEKIYRFASTGKRDDHFHRHGDEFNYSNAMEYEVGASDVVNNSESLHKIEAEDGDDVFYLEDTNEFVIVSPAGYIRTYFKPDDGIDYYNRQ
jgi:hypothetical protein